MAAIIPPAFGQTAPSSEASLLAVSGTIEIAPAGTSSWRPGARGQALHLGDQVRTGKNSRATIRLSNLSIIRLYELTTMTVQPPKAEAQNTAIEVKSGAAYFFDRDKPNETQFQTPSSSGAIRGTEFNLAVDAAGRMDLSLLDGLVAISNAEGSVQLQSGERVVTEKGRPPQKTPLINSIDVIQWTLYYPAVLDPDELGLSAPGQHDLAASLSAYRSGDLLEALAAYPAGHSDGLETERVYHAALLLAVGNVAGAQSILNGSFDERRPAALAEALREMIAAVKNTPWTPRSSPTLASEWLAASYEAQSRRDLPEALRRARQAVAIAPRFGFAQERLAELEFGFGHADAALAALRLALQLSPRNAQAQALKGFALASQNRIAAAQKAFELAIALDSSLANGWLGRGLTRIRQGDVNGGRKDLETAAALEPNRAFLRSYLGKAWALDRPLQFGWNTHLAYRELGLAMKLDPNDPTAWLYAALLDDQRNEVNQAIADLEHSEALNDNRAVFRSKFLLDQDAAVRSANLAQVYEDAGLNDVAVRESTKAVDYDYANYSAHLFLSESYDALQDPKREDLRYQTPWEDELLLANILAPVGAGVLSQNISQQEYSKLFQADGLGISSETQFFSRGAWLENASQYGTMRDFSYSFDAYYYTDPGWRPNNSIDSSDFDAEVKMQLSPKDTLYAEIERTEVDAGDVFEHYNYNLPEKLYLGDVLATPGYDPTFHSEEIQDPNVVAGYHRDWGTGNHTLVLYRTLQDYVSTGSGEFTAPIVSSAAFLQPYTLSNNLERTSELNSLEVQHIYQNDWQNIIVGGRYQNENIQSADMMTAPPPNTGAVANVTRVRSDFERLSFYGYYQLTLFDTLRLTAGATYDWEHFPLNIENPPFSAAETDRARLSPKAGADWTFWDNTRLRAEYAKSMSGLFNDSSTLIEPSQIAGFNQEYRNLIPESSGFGTPPAAQFETWGLGIDHKFPTGTYVDVEGRLLTSRGGQLLGGWNSGIVLNPLVASGATTAQWMQSEYFQEKDAFASVSQLIGKDLAVGTQYSLTSVDLTSRVFTPPGTINASDYDLHEDSTLNGLTLFANYYVPCGFFAEVQGRWWDQYNIEGMNEPGDDFWQLNLYAGYRFPRRHAEVTVGVQNVTGQDYRVDPVTYFLEQAHTRTFVASFKFNF